MTKTFRKDRDVAGADKARKRKQSTQAARAVAAARGSNSDKRNLILGIAVVVILAAVVAVGVVYARNQQQQREAIPASHPAAEYSATLQADGTVLAGSSAAKAKLDVYEDFICPACGALEARDGAKIEQALGSGKLQITYHPVAILDRNSVPPGYSSRATNAALAAAAAGKWADYHHSLFAKGSQAQEGTAGYDNAKLIKLGQDLGITGTDFADAVNNGKYATQVTQLTSTATSDKNLLTDNGQGPGFGTPTIAQNDKKVDYKSPDWLDQLIATANKG